MQARFKVEADPSRDLIRIEMAGFFTQADIDAFIAARREAHAQLTCRSNRHLTLNDLREIKIQSQEAVAAFQGMLAAPTFRSRRLAFVVSPSLARGQLSRALAGREARLFPTIAAAERWLLSDDAETQSLAS